MRADPLEQPETAARQPTATASRRATALDGAPRSPRGRGRWRLILVAIVALAGVWYLTHRGAAPGGAAAGHGGMDGPVPATVTTAGRQDVPIYLNGIGTVQAYNTVTVHSRVDGQILRIAFAEGQDVNAGDTLAIVDPAPFQAALDQSIARHNQDEAQLANAKLDLQRYNEMLAKKVISSQQYDTQRALVDQLTATVAADAAAIASARVQLGYTTIISPISGRVGIRQLDVGNIIHASDANGLVVITQLQPISVLFTLPEQNLRLIHRESLDGTGMRVLAVDRDDNSVLDTGSVAVINNQIDQTTGTIQVKATFPNAKYQLWPGQFVNARLLLTTRKGGVVVPAQVVQNGPEGAFVYVVQPDDTVQMRPVKTTQADNNLALVDSGLQPGEKVVLEGQYKLQPGSHIRPPGSAPAGSPGAHHQHQAQ